MNYEEKMGDEKVEKRGSGLVDGDGDGEAEAGVGVLDSDVIEEKATRKLLVKMDVRCVFCLPSPHLSRLFVHDVGSG